MAQADMKVEHDIEKKEFYLEMENSSGGDDGRAVLQYEWQGENQVELYHTEVPPVFRGKGVGKILAKAALEHFTDKRIKMTPTCSFIQKYVKDNPRTEYKELIVGAQN